MDLRTLGEMIKLILLFLLPLVFSQERDNHTTWDDDTFRWIIPSETVTCGKVQLSIPTPLVVNGNATLEGQWPWQVAIYRTESVNLNFICGGTVITHKHVITAAHCTTIAGLDPFVKVEENSLTVYLGKHNLITSRRGVQTRSVELITVHPAYNSTVISSDLSILRFQEAVLYSDWVQPACLWPADMKDLSYVEGQIGSVVGWGNSGLGILHLVEMPVVDHLTCLRSYSEYFDKVLTNYTYCAGRKDGRSACNGDSGGGMVFNLNGTWYLRGLVSTSPVKNNEFVCDPSHYVIFTDIAKYLPWIYKNIRSIIGVLLALAISSNQQSTPTSPCPDVLKYEPAEPNADRWYATINLPPSSRTWLFLTITLDTRADFLGNWVGEVVTQDNINFKIDNAELKFKPKPIRFFVKHDRDSTAPKVQAIRLGHREICNADNPTIKEVQPFAPAPPIDTPSSSTYESTSGSSPYSPADYKVSINLNNNTECGTVLTNNPVALVVNGAPTLEGQWPWQVALYKTEDVNHYYICGGTLVTPEHIITAAHCTTESNYYPVLKFHESALTVYLGKHNLRTSIRGVQVRFVRKIKVHPEYDPSLLSRDLSILVLQEPVQYTEWVQPACLWPEHLVDVTNIVGQSGSVVGWGNDGSGKLMLVMMPVVDEVTCIRSKSDFFARSTSNYTFCAGFRDGRSACNGDSGGGMVFNLDGSWYLRGVVSVAPAKNNEPICDPSHYVVFTDVAQFLPWIKDNIKD